MTVQTPLHRPGEEAERNGAEGAGRGPSLADHPGRRGRTKLLELWCLLPGLKPGWSPQGLWALRAGAASGPDALPPQPGPRRRNSTGPWPHCRSICRWSWTCTRGRVSPATRLPSPGLPGGGDGMQHPVGGPPLHPLPSSLCPGVSSPFLTPPRLSLPHRAVLCLGEPLPAPLG